MNTITGVIIGALIVGIAILGVITYQNNQAAKEEANEPAGLNIELNTGN